uniref:Signal transduction response regulator receiver region domain-containing protein n=1 Tax=uncultured microorganism TaxID=358574 RepID=F8UHS4_9ZZZZ|nr:signal transduction response regulator receiver region domain-containing protein [uncultured microorganism]
MEIKKKILIVDDEKFVTDALEGFFHSKGYQIFKAEDGQVCLEIIKNENLDLVLLDIKLPKVDGIEILKLLRRDYPKVKVIIMTAYDMEYKAMIDAIGSDAFFIKPLLIDELTEKVEELLSQGEVVAKSTEKKPESKPGFSKGPKECSSGKIIPKVRLLIVSPRGLISGLLKDYFSQQTTCNGIYEVAESGLEQLEYIKKFKPDIILLDIALVGMLGEFGLTLTKIPQPPKEIILFGDPAVKWEEAEGLIKRGVKFIEIPMDLNNETYPIKETIQRLNEAVREVCAKHQLFEKEG